MALRQELLGFDDTAVSLPPLAKNGLAEPRMSYLNPESFGDSSYLGFLLMFSPVFQSAQCTVQSAGAHLRSCIALS